jgi:hypothetical protein
VVAVEMAKEEELEVMVGLMELDTLFELETRDEDAAGVGVALGEGAADGAAGSDPDAEDDVVVVLYEYPGGGVPPSKGWNCTGSGTTSV